MSEQEQDFLIEEKRSIPIHILNYMDARLGAIQAHTDAKIDKLGEKITNLTNSINFWMEKQPAAILERCEEMIDEAIPSSPDDPNASRGVKRREHRQVHIKWMQGVSEEVARWKRIREQIIIWVITGALGIILIALWRYFLDGPK